jgi:hypothetical protein
VIALSVRLDVAKINLMLSSECSQIGTGSSNSPRSASQSVRFTYIFGGVRNSARNVAFFLPAAHRRASTHAEFTRFGEHSLRANRNGSLQRLNALWAAFAPPSPSPGGRKLNFNRSDLSVPERPRLPLIVASLSRGLRHRPHRLLVTAARRAAHRRRRHHTRNAGDRQGERRVSTPGLQRCLQDRAPFCELRALYARVGGRASCGFDAGLSSSRRAPIRNRFMGR